MKGHKEATQYLLEYCDVGLTESDGRNSLDLAIDNLHEYVFINIQYSLFSFRLFISQIKKLNKLNFQSQSFTSQ